MSGCLTVPLPNELAVRANDQPPAAELDDVLAGDPAGLPVADVVVERPPSVGDLAAAVVSLRRPDQLWPDAVAGDERALLVVDGPGLRAGAVTAAPSASVLRERVEHAAATVEEDFSVAGRFRAQGRRRARQLLRHCGRSDRRRAKRGGENDE